MLNGLLGKKVGMTRIFGVGGKMVPVTVLEVGPCTVVQVKTEAKDKYQAVQLGFGQKAEKNTNKPMGGHFKKAGMEPKQVIREVRVEDSSEFEAGQTITADIFTAGDKVKIIGKTKGRGFTGVVKRHGFGGGRATHGCTTHDAPGSIGMSATPARVVKGKRMPGQYGNTRMTVRNLQVVDVRPDQNLVMVKGAVPGANGGMVYLQKV